MSEWTNYLARWKLGCGARECAKATRIVHARGKIPCDVFFLGEAPGGSENVLGEPFVGPAGKHLDKMISLSGIDRHRLLFANLVGCIPLDDNGKKQLEPEHEQIMACAERLEELVHIARPRLIVTVGTMADTYTAPGYRDSIHLPGESNRVKIVHPASILRKNVVEQGLATQRCVVTLRNAAESLDEG